MHLEKKNKMPNINEKYKQHEEAFSLVELLVVILIISILTAIAIPVFLNQRKSAYDASLKSDVKSIALEYSTRLAQGKLNKDFTAEAEGRDRIIVFANDVPDVTANITNSPTSAPMNAKDIKGLEDLKVSSGTTAELIIKNPAAVTGGGNPTPENQFCIVSSNIHSNYPYRAFKSNYVPYEKALYYSSLSGGVKTVEELYNAGVRMDGNKDDPCYGHVSAWERRAKP